MTKRFLSSVVAVAALAACGSSNPTGADLCNKAKDVINSFNSKNTACLQGSTAIDPPSSTCTQDLAQCSSADQGLLNTFLDCLNGTPACTTATISDWATKIQACSTPMESGLSQACKTSMGIGS